MILSIQYLFKLLHHQSDRAQLNSSKHWWESKKQLLKPICLVRVIIITLMDLVPICILYANNKILPCLGHWNITSYDWCSMFYTQDVNISPPKNNDIRNVSLELCLDILLVLKFLIKIKLTCMREILLTDLRHQSVLLKITYLINFAHYWNKLIFLRKNNILNTPPCIYKS